MIRQEITYCYHKIIYGCALFERWQPWCYNSNNNSQTAAFQKFTTSAFHSDWPNSAHERFVIIFRKKRSNSSSVTPSCFPNSSQKPRISMIEPRSCSSLPIVEEDWEQISVSLAIPSWCCEVFLDLHLVKNQIQFIRLASYFSFRSWVLSY
jgi:hypothetical protein